MTNSLEQVEKKVGDAFEFAKRHCLVEDGKCIEASVNMHKYLKDRGVNANLWRYVLPGGDGHWTLVTPAGEFDPTIACWKAGAPAGSACGELYRVTGQSPHVAWQQDRHVDVKAAYASTWIEQD
jgi:hypothetical protein